MGRKVGVPPGYSCGNVGSLKKPPEVARGLTESGFRRDRLPPLSHPASPRWVPSPAGVSLVSSADQIPPTLDMPFPCPAGDRDKISQRFISRGAISGCAGVGCPVREPPPGELWSPEKNHTAEEGRSSRVPFTIIVNSSLLTVEHSYY